MLRFSLGVMKIGNEDITGTLDELDRKSERPD